MRGSLRESVLLLYVLKKEEIEYSKELAMAQIQIDKEKGLEQFEKYRKKMFPWVDTAKRREKDIHQKVLLAAVKAGPMTVTPLQQPKARSRLVQRREVAKPTVLNKKRLDNIYSQIGKVVPK